MSVFVETSLHRAISSRLLYPDSGVRDFDRGPLTVFLAPGNTLVEGESVGEVAGLRYIYSDTIPSSYSHSDCQRAWEAAAARFSDKHCAAFFDILQRIARFHWFFVPTYSEWGGG